MADVEKVIVPTQFSDSTITWSRYSDPRFGYSFEYPSQYENASSDQCELQVFNRTFDIGQEVYVGTGLAIFIREQQRDSWKDEACLFFQDIFDTTQAFVLDEIIIAGEPALAAYFTKDIYPNCRTIVFQHDGLIYIIDKIPNPECNIYGIRDTSELLYQHFVDTFKFNSH